VSIEDPNISIIDACVLRPCISLCMAISLYLTVPTPVLLSMCLTAVDPQLYQGTTLKDKRTAGRSAWTLSGRDSWHEDVAFPMPAPAQGK